MVQGNDSRLLRMAGRIIRGPDHDDGVGDAGSGTDPYTGDETPAVRPRQTQQQDTRDRRRDVRDDGDPGTAVARLEQEVRRSPERTQ
jgi:hypothetical protein